MLFAARMRVANVLWERWLALHGPRAQADLLADRRLRMAFRAGVSMALADADRPVPESVDLGSEA